METTKKLSAYLLIFIMLLSISKNTLMHYTYQYNKSLFISLFCINKSKPQMHCDGKCALEKMQQEDEAANALKKTHEEISYYYKTTIISTIFTTVERNNFNQLQGTYIDNHYSYLYCHTINKPPVFV